MSLRVGVIGLGEVAQHMHLPLLASDPRFEIAAVSDISATLTETLGARYGVKLRKTDANAVIDAPDLDAVFILTPDHLHAGQLDRAIAADKHVFVEKPACLTEEELRPLVSRLTQKVVFVGYMRLFSRPFLALKQRLPELGHIRHVRIRDLICEAPFFVAQTHRTLRADDVPADAIAAGRATAERLVRAVMGADADADEVRAYRLLTGLGSHSLSAMRDLFGVPVGVLGAHQRSGLTATAAYDYGSFLCSYEACVTDIPVFDAGIEILTDATRYDLTTDTPYIRNLPTRLTITTAGPDGACKEVLGPFHEDPFRIQLDAFHDAIALGAPVRSTLADALDDLELIAKTARTFRSG